jgi:hypothetical protein
MYEDGVIKCKREACPCSHLDPCEAGWVLVTHKEIIKRNLRNGTIKEIEQVYDSYTFCPTCDPERAHIVATSNSSEERDRRLAYRSDFKIAENYDKENASRTRTL